MLADYLSQLPSSNPNILPEVTKCFDPFQPDLLEQQKADADLQKMNHFRIKGEWPVWCLPVVGCSLLKGVYLSFLSIAVLQCSGIHLACTFGLLP